MTLDQHVRVMIGDLVVRVAALAADNDILREQLAAAQAKYPDLVPPSAAPRPGPSADEQRVANGQGPD
jgi:hypothetical protein